MRLARLFVVLAALPGCSPRYIPNTDVEDTDDNRRVIEFCEVYRHAVESRDVPKLLRMADDRYYEDGGNADASDDLDRAGLDGYLQSRFRETRAIRYEIRYRRVSDGPKQTVRVDYTYTASYKIPTPAGEVWRRRVAENRLELVPDKDGFRILAGM